MSAVEDLARQLKEHPRWEVQPGTLSLPDSKGRTWRYLKNGWRQESGRRFRDVVCVDDFLPDVDDPATQGGLRDMVEKAGGVHAGMIEREMMTDDEVGYEVSYGPWNTAMPNVVRCHTLGEGLLRALLAVWEVVP